MQALFLHDVGLQPGSAIGGKVTRVIPTTQKPSDTLDHPQMLQTLAPPQQWELHDEVAVQWERE
jgi:hypothetical protein